MAGKRFNIWSVEPNKTGYSIKQLTPVHSSTGHGLRFISKHDPVRVRRKFDTLWVTTDSREGFKPALTEMLTLASSEAENFLAGEDEAW